MLPKRAAQACSRDGVEYLHKNKTRNEAPDMGPEGNTSDIGGRDTRGKQLEKEPDSEKDKGWNFDELNEEKDEDQRQDFRTRIEEKISSHDS